MIALEKVITHTNIHATSCTALILTSLIVSAIASLCTIVGTSLSSNINCFYSSIHWSLFHVQISQFSL